MLTIDQTKGKLCLEWFQNNHCCHITECDVNKANKSYI